MWPFYWPLKPLLRRKGKYLPEVVVRSHVEAVNFSAQEIKNALAKNILYSVEAVVVFKRRTTKRVATMCETIPLSLYFLWLGS